MVSEQLTNGDHGWDPNSLILQSIAGLCARGGIPTDRAAYFHDKVQPLVSACVEFLVESMPEQPNRALLLWLATGGGGCLPDVVPDDLLEALRNWVDQDQGPAPEVAPAVVPSSEQVAPAKSALKYLTPAGNWLSVEDQRALHTVELTDAQKLQLVQKVPMFGTLGQAELAEIAELCEVTTYLEGEEAMKNGEASQGMHIVASGTAKRYVSHEVGVLSSGDAIGETEMLRGLPFNETVEAVGGPMTTIHMDALVFKALGLKKKIGNMRRKKCLKLRDVTVPGGGRRASATNHIDRAVAEDDFSMIEDAIAANSNLREVLNLGDEQIQYCAREAYKKHFEAGEVVFEKGEYGHRFYIIISGAFEVHRSDVFSEDMANGVVRLKSGESFGELALLYHSPRTATVTCKRAGSVWVLSRQTFRNCKQMQMEAKISEHSSLIRSVALFEEQGAQMSAICNALEERYFIQNEVIVTQGTVIDCFYVIAQGQCLAMDMGDAKSMTRGAYFGDQALLEPQECPVTVRVTSDHSTVLILDRRSFLLCLSQDPAGPIEGQPQSKEELGQLDGIGRGELERIGVLGAGTFGCVTLERHLATGRLFALKAISKAHIARDGLKQMVLNEKACQQLMNSDFVVRLLTTYRDAQFVYLLLEPCFGGEIFDVFHGGHQDLCGSEVHANFYAACAALGLEHMHSHRVVYRDLKLENCLLTLNGYLKLTDLGISKILVGKTFTVCGTADYFAPEMLRQTGHNRAVDWWALGVMIYMMMSGRSPFEAPDTMKVYRKIIKGFAKVSFPADFPEHCMSMIKGLCQRNPEERLTMGSLGIQNFKDHPWYRAHHFNWLNLTAQTMLAPLTPALTEEDVIEKARTKVLDEIPDCPPMEDGLDEDPSWDDAFDSEMFGGPAVVPG